VEGEGPSIRDEAQRLRAADAVRRRTLFMSITGPLMVLAVLEAVYVAWRSRSRLRQPRPA
jgi:hypothetical protein